MNKLLLTIISLIGSYSALSQSTTWYQIPTGTTTKLNVVEFASTDVGYIGGNDSLLLKTTDGGQTWDSINFSGVNWVSSGYNIVNLKFVTEDIGYMAVGPYTGVFKTIDGGNTWSALSGFQGVLCYNWGLYFFSEDNGAIGGSGCFQGEHIEMMSSGSFTAPTINTPSWNAMNMVVDIDFLNSNFGIAASAGDRFLRTTDAGATWDTIPAGTGDPLTGVEIINDTLVYATYANPGNSWGVLVSTDAGLTWNYDMNSATFAYPGFNGLEMANNGHLFVAAEGGFGGNGMIFEQMDTGSGWWNYWQVDQAIWSIDTYGDSTVFAVGDSGYVVTNIDPALMSIDQPKNSIEELVVFPNPVSESLNIKWPAEAQQSNSTVIIRTLDGKEIRTLQHTTLIDVSDLSSGVYLLEVHSQNVKYISRFIKN